MMHDYYIRINLPVNNVSRYCKTFIIGLLQISVSILNSSYYFFRFFYSSGTYSFPALPLFQCVTSFLQAFILFPAARVLTLSLISSGVIMYPLFPGFILTLNFQIVTPFPLAPNSVVLKTWFFTGPFLLII